MDSLDELANRVSRLKKIFRNADKETRKEGVTIGSDDFLFLQDLGATMLMDNQLYVDGCRLSKLKFQFGGIGRVYRFKTFKVCNYLCPIWMYTEYHSESNFNPPVIPIFN